MTYKGPPSDHFDGKKFHNFVVTENKRNFWEFLKLKPWNFDKENEDKWVWREILQIPPLILKNNKSKLVFVNHATFLLQIDGVNVLTDPIWSEQCGPFGKFGPSRFHEPGIKFEDLPKIDIVLVSHNHFDHMDLPTLKRLEKIYEPIFLIGLGNSRYLSFIQKKRLIELDWWQSTSILNLEISMIPAQHWSTRTPFDVNESLWGGFFLRSKNSSIFFAGDSAEGPHFEMVRKSMGEPDIALLPIGAYLPRDFMESSHMGPKEAVEAFKILGAKKAFAMHFGTFPLGKDGPNTASNELSLILKRENLLRSFQVPLPGMSIDLK